MPGTGRMGCTDHVTGSERIAKSPPPALQSHSRIANYWHVIISWRTIIVTLLAVLALSCAVCIAKVFYTFFALPARLRSETVTVYTLMVLWGQLPLAEIDRRLFLAMYIVIGLLLGRY